MAIENLITDHIDLWTAAVRPKSSAGRGSNSKLELTGIKKLRELILELAVRGKLVPQDPNDEPAAVLLERIAAEKARLEKAGKMKKAKPLPVIVEDEQPFKLPNGWFWRHLEDVFYPISVSKNKVKTSELLDKGEYPVVDQGQSFVAGYVDNSDLVNMLPGPVIVFGDHTSCLKYIDFNFVAGADGVKILRPICCDEQYFFLVCKTLPVESRGYGRHYSRLIDNLFPLPPFSEQLRIVAKVDELMALCDQLEQQSEAQLAAHQTLVEALLVTLTDSSDADELAQNWARLAQHFDILFTTETSIDALKQTVLQLAVMGKLVPQDPTDEPASALLARIAAEKAQLVKEKKIKKEKPLPAISEDEKPFELPTGWEWSKCLDICHKITDGEHATPKRSEAGYYLLSARNVTDNGIKTHDVDYVPLCEFERIRKRCDPNVGDILISCSGSIGRVALVDKDNAYSMVRSAAMIRPSPKTLNIVYLMYMLKSPYLQAQMRARSRQSAQANLFLGAISNLVTVIPPYKEQQRIVARVDELISLCDQLKVHLQTSQQTQFALAEALVEGALS